MKSSRTVRSFALLGFFLASGASAFTRSSTTWAPNRLPVTYKVNVTSIPSSLGQSAGLAAIDNGFATWTNAGCTAWRSRNAGTSTVTRGSSSDNENSALWISGSWPAELGSVNSTIGITTTTYQTGGYFVDGDMQYNNVGFRWGTGSGGTVDTQSITTHEEGHFLGLGHTTVAGSVMVASYSSGQVRALSADDRSGVCTLYPPGYEDAGVLDAGPAPGSLGFGATCVDSSQCASGICIQGSSGGAYCSKNCTDDCGCPSAYACFPLSSGGRVCGLGTNRCGADAGVRDAGTTPRDASVPTPDASAPADATVDEPDAAVDEPPTNTLSSPLEKGCGCAVVGSSRGTERWGGVRSLALALALGGVVRRRRRASHTCASR